MTDDLRALLLEAADLTPHDPHCHGKRPDFVGGPGIPCESDCRVSRLRAAASLPDGPGPVEIVGYGCEACDYRGHIPERQHFVELLGVDAMYCCGKVRPLTWADTVRAEPGRGAVLSIAAMLHDALGRCHVCWRLRENTDADATCRACEDGWALLGRKVSCGKHWHDSPEEAVGCAE